MRNRLIAVSLGVLVSLAAGESASAQPTLKAVRTSQPPKLDGNPDDPTWKRAPELKLDAVGRGGQAEGQSITVVLKAVYDADHVYFLLRWQDATKDATHKSYVWNEERNAYVPGPDREDNAAISFPIRGKFTADMLSGEDELWDVWHWKAGRGNPVGWVAVVKPGRMMLELEGVSEELAQRAMQLAAAKLPVKTRFVSRATQL